MNHEGREASRRPPCERFLGVPSCPLWLNGLQLLSFSENAGVKFHDFTHVGQEIGQAVVAGIRVILVPYAFRLELPMQGGGAVFKTEVILLAAVKVDRQTPQTRLALPGQGENTILLPMPGVNRFAEGGSYHSAQGRAGMSCG